jgi:glutaminyl-peptide cyclotransferase
MTQSPTPPSRCLPRCTLLAAAVVLLGGAAIGAWVFFGDRGFDGRAAAAGSTLKLDEIPFNGARAYEYLKQLCAIGPRPSGSQGMEIQQKLLAAHFQKLGGQVEFQRFRVPHPQTGQSVPMANIVVHWRPQSTSRILLCAHYDTLPYPMEDRENPQGPFVGANDNASGVAVLMELAHDMPALKTDYGIDFLLLDAEEFRFRQQDRFFLGSEYFAREYVKGHVPYRYRWGVLLDMVGDADLQIYQERNSLSWPDTRPLVEDIWGVAARLGVREFVARPRHQVDDDHVMLHNLAHIPCIDVIDFDYPPWHTQGDTPDKCSPLSLAKVGWVIREWLTTVKE